MPLKNTPSSEALSKRTALHKNFVDAELLTQREMREERTIWKTAHRGKYLDYRGYDLRPGIDFVIENREGYTCYFPRLDLTHFVAGFESAQDALRVQHANYLTLRYCLDRPNNTYKFFQNGRWSKTPFPKTTLLLPEGTIPFLPMPRELEVELSNKQGRKPDGSLQHSIAVSRFDAGQNLNKPKSDVSGEPEDFWDSPYAALDTKRGRIL